ncbi:class I SAM-dependent methyltransferase [Streptomyces yaanensis]|uniref:Class I SAM-dependent methyltransferase n=1 Tax=Streptomyces yaanensis TaxID=1142239 RepID=A0ABV7SDC3_9ACTN|nr:class I SAM-dependent methyltransferase [Streptomyces sp. CGMCC 4.7035]WNB96740.1 class I SAM-dependent methyltransferase [Streptomyces sp. CGMCC 4.7035]
MVNASIVNMGQRAREGAKKAAKRVLPPHAAQKARDLHFLLKGPERKRTEAVFLGASTAPEYLPASMLPRLQKSYPPGDFGGYDETSLEKCGRSRAREILGLPGATEAISFLEVGCWDGMVSAALQESGKRCTGVDLRTEGFDGRSSAAGVELRQMDAESLEFPDESFDYVFSYNSFEHFARPDRVLGEMKRVTKKGGSIWLSFAPLYFSPYGEHAYKSITVPYCQLLFSGDVLNAFCREHGLREIDFSHVNRWRVGDFRGLWEKNSADLERIKYREGHDPDHLGLVRKYPSCFRSKTDSFDDLTVSSMEVLFRRTA